MISHLFFISYSLITIRKKNNFTAKNPEQHHGNQVIQVYVTRDQTYQHKVPLLRCSEGCSITSVMFSSEINTPDLSGLT